MISSIQHPFIKYLVTLRQERAERHKAKAALVTGEKLISDLAKSLPPLQLFHTSPSPPLPCKESFHVSSKVLRKISDLPIDEGMAALFPIPPEAETFSGDHLLVLDGLQDPGNVGTLFRTALGLGWAGAILTDQAADPFNPKCIRAAQGASFLLPYAFAEDLSRWKGKRKLFAADAQGKPLTPPYHKPLMLILGNEGHGVSIPGGEPIAIPLASQVESLNVAAAGAIFMYEMSR